MSEHFTWSNHFFVTTTGVKLYKNSYKNKRKYIYIYIYMYIYVCIYIYILDSLVHKERKQDYPCKPQPARPPLPFKIVYTNIVKISKKHIISVYMILNGKMPYIHYSS